ncbi:MAG: exodeoxyribonuclease VII large subunit [Pirellulaceae bacterium]|nr:exodeoxyribonuclease VII large subunit [Pirellulaceae bacterium]
MWDEDTSLTEGRGQAAEAPLSISQLNWFVKRLIEGSLPRVWLEGEISDLSRPSSGHVYFTLKDEKSQVRAVIWRSTAQRLKLTLKDGLSIICCGAVEVYPPRGSYQIVISQILPQGVGPLQLALQQLHQRLAKEGLMEADRKKPLPRFPRRIGFVTSPSGAAIHDFMESAEVLWSDYHLYVIPSRVQGDGAAQEIVQGIRLAQRIRPALDVLVVGRGGGSLEDLWCFNEESVVRALAACKIPTVSAVGHEVDVTLSDLVADARALTPSQAASLVLPNRSQLDSTLRQLRHRVEAHARGRLQRVTQQLRSLSQRSVLLRPHLLHQVRKQQVDELERRAADGIRARINLRGQRLSELARATHALSPLGVLRRGYSLTMHQGSRRPLTSFREVSVGQTIRTQLSEGIVVSRVESTNDNPD